MCDSVRSIRRESAVEARERVAQGRGVRQLGAKSEFIEELGAPSTVAEGEEHAVELFEIAGAIKWFDVSKGYGFIVPDSGQGDVLLHVTTLRRSGFQTAHEGARVACEAQRGPKGLQVFRVLSMDKSTAIHPSQSSAGRTHVQVSAISPAVRLSGNVGTVVGK